MNLKSLLPLIPATVLACLSLTSASAAPIAIVNASFENPELPDPINWSQGYSIGYPGHPSALTAIPGWIISQGNPSFLTNYSAGVTIIPNSPDGAQSAYAGNTQAEGSFGTLTQTTSASFVAGTIYQLSAFVSPYGNSNLGAFRISLLKDGVAVATEEVDSQDIDLGDFQQISLNYTALTGGGVIGIQLVFESGSNEFQLGLYDNVTLNAVPEPSTVFLFGLAGMTLIFRKRTSRHKLIG